MSSIKHRAQTGMIMIILVLIYSFWSMEYFQKKIIMTYKPVLSFNMMKDENNSGPNINGFCEECQFNHHQFGNISCLEGVKHIMSSRKCKFFEAHAKIVQAQPEKCLTTIGYQFPDHLLKQFHPQQSKNSSKCQYAHHCQSRMSKNVSSGPPHPELERKIWYFTMGSYNYRWALAYFIESLVDVGIEEEMIGVMCIDNECKSHFQTHFPKIRLEFFGMQQIEGTPCQANPAISNTRCKVSMGKAEIIRQVLLEDHAIFFFDADVLILQHPYKSMKPKNSNLPLYIQKEKHQSNFGVLLAFPDPFTLALFDYIRIVFYFTQAWDQDIFNTYLLRIRNEVLKNSTAYGHCHGICGEGLDYEQLAEYEYINAMQGTYNLESEGGDHKKYVMAHGTCVEGGVLPQMVLKTLFGAPNKEKYYRQKTVTLNSNELSIEDADQVDKSMRVLVYIAKHTGRAIRLQTQYMPRMMFRMRWYRLISSEYIFGELGVDLVEDIFYEHAKNRIGKTSSTTAVVSLHNTTAAATIEADKGISESSFMPSRPIQKLEELVENGMKYYGEIDELVFSMSELTMLDEHEIGALAGEELGYKNGSWTRPFTCVNVLREIAGCTAICDGGHF